MNSQVWEPSGSGGSCRFHIHKEVKLENNSPGSRCLAAEHRGLEKWISEEKVMLVPKSKKDRKKAKNTAQQWVAMDEVASSFDDTLLDKAPAEEVLFALLQMQVLQTQSYTITGLRRSCCRKHLFSYPSVKKVRKLKYPSILCD